jgi:hypothetical protein
MFRRLREGSHVCGSNGERSVACEVVDSGGSGAGWEGAGPDPTGTRAAIPARADSAVEIETNVPSGDVRLAGIDALNAVCSCRQRADSKGGFAAADPSHPGQKKAKVRQPPRTRKPGHRRPSVSGLSVHPNAGSVLEERRLYGATRKFTLLERVPPGITT